MASYTLAAQVAITTDGTDPNGSAMLDVKSANKGLLIPQVALTGVNDATTIPTPATSLLIYNTATIAGLTPGYFYNSGTTTSPFWTRLATGIIDGSETKVIGGTNIWITGNGTASSPYVINATDGGGVFTHYVGENYGGGIVFYVYDGGQHGLIVAPADQGEGTVPWYAGTYTKTMAFADGINAGKMNTSIIIANQGFGDGGDYAAKLCVDYNGGGYGDWYLPSRYELMLLLEQRDMVGGFAWYNYWSSTEHDNILGEWAWTVEFSSEDDSAILKNYLFHVRAIRSF